MTADKILDWIIAVVVLFFIFAPLVGSLFVKKKVVHHKKPKPSHPKIKPKPADMPKVVQKPQDIAIPKKKSPKKKKLKYGSLKQAVVLSEILKRPYDD
jgi:hypothetical protein